MTSGSRSSRSPRPSRPAAWPILLAYLAAFVFTLCASALLVFVVALARAGGHASRVAAEAAGFALSASGLVAVPFVNATVLLAIALASVRQGRAPIDPDLRLGSTRGGAAEVALVSLGMLGLSFACGAVADLAGLRDGGVMETLAGQLRAPSPIRFALALGAIAIAPAVAEEIFFRGFMQPKLTLAWGRWPAILVTAAAFGLMHLEWVQSSLAFCAGIFLGWSADRAGSIRPTILAHALNNGVFVTLAAFGADTGDTQRAAVTACVAGAFVWAGATVVLLRQSAVTTANGAP